MLGTKSVAQKLLNKKIFPDVIFHSPKLRTSGTATIIGNIFHDHANFEIKPEGSLTEENNIQFLKEILSKLGADFRTVYVVTHEPVIGACTYPFGLMVSEPLESQASVFEFDEKDWKDIVMFDAEGDIKGKRVNKVELFLPEQKI